MPIFSLPCGDHLFSLVNIDYSLGLVVWWLPVGTTHWNRVGIDHGGDPFGIGTRAPGDSQTVSGLCSSWDKTGTPQNEFKKHWDILTNGNYYLLGKKRNLYGFPTCINVLELSRKWAFGCSNFRAAFWASFYPLYTSKSHFYEAFPH